MKSILVTLAKRACSSAEDFVDYWEELYPEQYPDAEFLRHLKWKGGSLNAEDVTWLFRWKYRRLPSWSPSPVIRRLPELNGLRFKEGDSLERVAEELSITLFLNSRASCWVSSSASQRNVSTESPSKNLCTTRARSEPRLDSNPS